MCPLLIKNLFLMVSRKYFFGQAEGAIGTTYITDEDITDEAEERSCEEACLAERTEAPCGSQEVMRSHLRRVTRESWRKKICIFVS